MSGTSAPPERPTPVQGRSRDLPVQITDFSCSMLDEAEQALGVTYWFEAEPHGDPYPVTVHLRGRAKDGAHGGDGETTFAVTSTVENVVPGSGRVAVTTRVPHLVPGEWEVTATPVEPASEGSGAPRRGASGPRLAQGTTSGRTGFAAFVNNAAPGVLIGAWPALVGTGFILALVLQTVLARQLDLPAPRLLLLTVVAGTLGLFGAKGYYLVTHPRERQSLLVPGMSVQGFVITVITVLVVGSFLLGLPLGAVLDATAPGMLFGMAVGRVGCLLGGCCAGRPTSSRWGIWSSDRRVGIRRIPVQLLESALSAVLGTLALLSVLLLPASGGGLVLVASVAAYVLGRQILFPLRSISRATKHGRTVTSLMAVLVLVTSVGGLLLG